MNKVLSIAGFDPSAGAGILADIKTFERFDVYGFGVCTAVTVQNEYAFDEAGWLQDDKIIDQLECLFREHTFEFAKIGLIRDINTLDVITSCLVKNNPGIKIIWDPILKSSTGFSFHDVPEDLNVESIIERLFLITPNYHEAVSLGIEKGSICNVLVKGGHKEDDACNDELFLTSGQCLVFNGERLNGVSKHGSGCVLSAAIIAGLAQGQRLSEACQNAKEYMNGFLSSTDTLLGIHKKIFENA